MEKDFIRPYLFRSCSVRIKLIKFKNVLVAPVVLECNEAAMNC